MTPRGFDRTLPRFLVVGAGLALLYATLAALATSQLPLPKALASAIVWVLCIPVGFWAHRRFTFTARQAHRHGLWLYAATQALGIGISATVSFLLARGSFWPDLFVHLLAAALAAIASYLLNRRFVFPHPKAR
ncbi:MAG: GtrA family protein [Rhodobacterales bacterium]|nr:GtrA family protein [Rhodobacterales bacterium]